MPHSYLVWIIRPRVTPVAYSFKVSLTWDLVSRFGLISIIMESIHVNHASGERLLYKVSLNINKDIIVISILLNVLILQGPRDVRVSLLK